MSFMSFDYAMQAANAALQLHQNQGQNIKSTNDSVKTVGTANAQRKDGLMRQKVEAEYSARSADIKKEKAGKLMKLAEERKDNAKQAAFLVGAGTLLGGMIDGMFDMAAKDDNQMPEADQIGVMNDAQISEYATSFKIAQGNGNSESGAIAAYNPDQGNFSLIKVNTTTGRVDGFVNVSQTQMAEELWNATEGATDKNSIDVRSHLSAGPPPSFLSSSFEQGENGSVGPAMKADLKGLLFNNNGFFAKGSRTNVDADDSGENLVGRLLADPAPITNSYNQSAQGVMKLLENDGIRQGLAMTDKAVDNSREILKDEGALTSALDTVGEGVQKVLFKPLGTALNQFMKMAQVAKEYEDEFNEKVAEYEAAKKQAAAARQKLQKLEALLAAGSSAS